MKILGVLILIAGIVSLFFANYIYDQIGEGKTKIAQGEKAVSQGNKLFSLTPVTQQAGKLMTGGANKKLAQGKEDIARYEKIAGMLNTGGIVAIILGAGVFIFSFFYKKKRR